MATRKAKTLMKNQDKHDIKDDVGAITEAISEVINKDISEETIKETATYEASYASLKSFGEETLKIIEGFDQGTIQCEEAFNSLIVLAHAVYGWMPTILDILPKKPKTKKVDHNDWKSSVVNACCELLDSPEDYEKHERAERYQLLSQFTNNSYVGLSKFLHFLFPDVYAIWDSNIHFALTSNVKNSPIPFSSQANTLDNFIKYQIAMQKALSNSEQQPPDLKTLREIELHLFNWGKENKRGKDDDK